MVKLQDRDEILTEQIRNLTGIPETQPVEVETVARRLQPTRQENEMVSLAIQNDRDIQEAENERSAREHVLRGSSSKLLADDRSRGPVQRLEQIQQLRRVL